MPRRNPANSGVLDAKRMEAATLVFQGLSMNKAAERVGVSETTVRRWTEDPLWSAFLATLEASAIEHTVRRMRSLLGKSMTRLEAVFNDPEAEHGDIIRATYGLMDRTGIGPHSFPHTEPTGSAAELEEAILQRAESIRTKRATAT